MKLKKFKKYFLTCFLFSLIPLSFSFKNIKIKAKELLNKNFNLVEKDNNILLEKIKNGENFLIKINLNGNIKQIPLSEYIIGVAAAEMGLNFPIEAIKAQMVAALNYAIAKFGLNGVFLLGPSYQCYMSKEERIKKFGAEKEKEIENLKFMPMVMLYNNEVVEALYASCFPGKSRTNYEAWFNNNENYKKEYLASVYSPELDFYNEFNSSNNKEEFFKKYGQQANIAIDILNKNFKSQHKESINSVFEKVKKQHKEAKMPTNVNDSIKIISKFPSGYVNDLEAFGVKMKGGDLRRILNIRSSYFTVKILNNEFVFESVGNGHGVGMSQVGAMIYALKGLTFEKILSHYFNGEQNSNKIQFKQLKDVNPNLLFN